MTYLAKLGELTLKGSNLQEFENQLKHNAAKCLEGLHCKITLRAGRLYIECDENAEEKVQFTLNHLLGITGWAKAEVCEKTIEAINDTVDKQDSGATKLTTVGIVYNPTVFDIL